MPQCLQNLATWPRPSLKRAAKLLLILSFVVAICLPACCCSLPLKRPIPRGDRRCALKPTRIMLDQPCTLLRFGCSPGFIPQAFGLRTLKPFCTPFRQQAPLAQILRTQLPCFTKFGPRPPHVPVRALPKRRAPSQRGATNHKRRTKNSHAIDNASGPTGSCTMAAAHSI